MRRAFVLLLILTSLLWQSLTFSGRVDAFAGADEATHAFLHWQDAAHHHDGHDGASSEGYHQDASADSFAHLAADGALQLTGLASMPLGLGEGPPQAPPVQMTQPVLPPPVLEGPRRPPRALA